MSGAGHYFDQTPDAAPRPRTVTLAVPSHGAPAGATNRTLELATDSGVFSATRIDQGTLVLLRKAPAPPSSGAVVDLGCGYGPIALSLAARSPGAEVWAVDVNERALDLVRLNAEANGLANVHAARPEAVPGDLRLAALYSNPPIRIGKPALHDLLLRWMARLTDDGAAWLVVHRHLGSDSLARWLTDQGYAVTRLASHHGYRVLEVRRTTAP